jgi:hypothetical protein
MTSLPSAKVEAMSCNDCSGQFLPKDMCENGGKVCTAYCDPLVPDGNTWCCCADPSSTGKPTTIPIPTTLVSLGELITKASGITTPLSVVGFIFTVIYAGFVRMTAAGNPDKEGKSMKIAIGAAVGFAIMALAPLLVRILASLLDIDTALVE